MLKLATRAALVRLAIGLAAAAILLLIVGAFMIWMPGRSHKGALPPITDDQAALADRLRADVDHLAHEIGPRHVDRPEALNAAADWVAHRFEQIGYMVERETYQHDGRELVNIVAELPGRAAPARIVVVGAHYDTVPGSPGANDNGSGVAALLALAEHFHDNPPPATLRFVSFVNEELSRDDPEQIGSYVHARRSRERGDDIVAMMSMDGLGYYDDAENSQRYPTRGIGLIYPTRADFIAFITRTGDAGLVRQAVGAFRQAAAFPSQGAALPSSVGGVGWSDHWSFWQHGYGAFLVTDTLPFRYDAYHTLADLPGALDYDRLARVVEGLQAVVNSLAQ